MASRDDLTGQPQTSTPQDFPRTTPPISAIDHSWVFQATMEIQKSIGQLSEGLKTLREESKTHGEKLATIEKVLYAVSAVGTIALLVGSFLINKLWDPVLSALIAYAKSKP